MNSIIILEMTAVVSSILVLLHSYLMNLEALNEQGT